jgi:hypothetical protein
MHRRTPVKVNVPLDDSARPVNQFSLFAKLL